MGFDEEFGESEGEEGRQKTESKDAQPFQAPIGRVRLPRGREVLGVLEQRVGASRILIKCFDGKTRNCRVPGRLRRRLWLREGDIVLVEPWEHQSENKGDVIFKYSKAEAQWLKKKGFIKIEAEF